MLCGSRGFSVRASHGLLPPRAPDMLTVRIGQLTVWGLSPHQIRSLVGCSPNATLQAPPIAAARDERRLSAVACKRLFGAVLMMAPNGPLLLSLRTLWDATGGSVLVECLST